MPTESGSMFGFLNPRPHSFAYRQAYARLCMHQRQNYGLASLPFHSFEAVFLYQLAVDSGAVNANVLPNARCCKLSRRENVCKSSDGEIGKFCSSVAVLLASIKLDDDVRDSRSWLARGVKFVLNSRIRQCRSYFQWIDPNFEENVKQYISQHHQLEQLREPKPLHEYVEPTAKAFGYVFSLMGSVAPSLALRANELGLRVGSALIAFDCAVDWKRDRARNEYNPLADEDAVRRALEYSASELNSAAELCRLHFGHESQAGLTLSRVAERVLQPVVCATPQPTWRHAWQLAKQSFASLSTGQLALAGVAMSTNAGDTYGVQPDDNAGNNAGDKPWKQNQRDAKRKEEPQSSGGGNKNDCCPNVCCISGDCCEVAACCEIAACCA